MKSLSIPCCERPRVELPSQQGFSATALLIFGPMSLCPGGCPVRCRVLNSIPSLHPQAVLSGMSPDTVNTQNCPEARTTALQGGWRIGHNLSEGPSTEPGAKGAELLSTLSAEGRPLGSLTVIVQVKPVRREGRPSWTRLGVCPTGSAHQQKEEHRNLPRS